MIIEGDCVREMRRLKANSVDAVVTDPPYELGFMGKRWDASGVAFQSETWERAYAALKPGGHLLAFGGTRTYHRLACAIEDAGFEIRDCIAWVYGTGFPKSLDVSKAIDKAKGVKGTLGAPKSEAHAQWIKRGRMRGEDGHEGYQRPWMGDANAVEANARQYLPSSGATCQWQGWGTALKPAFEPILVARKPLDGGTVADNVLRHGVGALNIDACRVDMGAEYDPNRKQRSQTQQSGHTVTLNIPGHTQATYNAQGRWPANLVHDGSPDVLALFPDSAGQAGTTGKRKQGAIYGAVSNDGEGIAPRGDAGSAARFFYCAKASKADRGAGNNHPTVKPEALMRWLVKLITPPEGVILDPFTGSGSTGVAAALEGFRFIGIEREAEYAAIARKRIARACRASIADLLGRKAA